MTRNSYTILIVALALFVGGCGSKENTSETAEAKVGENITTDTGLMYVDNEMGEGDSPTKGQQVTVHYTGKLMDGTKFDSSVDRGTPFTFVIGVGQVIAGWDEGVISMKVGGKRELTIPSDLAYGERGAGGLIPPGATLVFDVELIAVN